MGQAIGYEENSGTHTKNTNVPQQNKNIEITIPTNTQPAAANPM